MVVRLPDGRYENVFRERDVIDIVRRYCGDELAALLESAKYGDVLNIANTAADQLYTIADCAEDVDDITRAVDRARAIVKRMKVHEEVKELCGELNEYLDRIENEAEYYSDKISELAGDVLKAAEQAELPDRFL